VHAYARLEPFRAEGQRRRPQALGTKADPLWTVSDSTVHRVWADLWIVFSDMSAGGCHRPRRCALPVDGRFVAEISSAGQIPSTIDRQIVSLAIPALGALVAEPLFVLVDSAVVGHLGTAQLAGLALASTVLVTVVGLCVFLAYATTATVARRLGAGDRRGAMLVGVDGP
jgi:hypothetical protein